MPIGRESGMPEVEYWESFFDPECILRRLGVGRETGDLAEFGCGYGTFTIPAARLISGMASTFDLNPEMVEFTNQRARESQVPNLTASLRDFMTEGTGLPDRSIDFVLLFNILHIEEPLSLLAEAKRILKQHGRIGVIHWRSDIATPRGPSLSIRTTIKDCRQWGDKLGLLIREESLADCCDWHWGLTMSIAE